MSLGWSSDTSSSWEGGFSNTSGAAKAAGTAEIRISEARWCSNIVNRAGLIEKLPCLYGASCGVYSGPMIVGSIVGLQLKSWKRVGGSAVHQLIDGLKIRQARNKTERSSHWIPSDDP